MSRIYDESCREKERTVEDSGAVFGTVTGVKKFRFLFSDPNEKFGSESNMVLTIHLYELC